MESYIGKTERGVVVDLSTVEELSAGDSILVTIEEKVEQGAMKYEERTRKEGRNVVLTLVEPLEIGGLVKRELTIKRPKGKHFRKIGERPTTDDLLKLAGKLCGEPDSTIDELDGEDTMALLDIVGKHFESFQ